MMAVVRCCGIGIFVLSTFALRAMAAPADDPPAATAAHAASSPAENAFASVKHNRARLRTLLRKLPKGGNLHAHSSGEIDPDFLIELAAQHGFYVRADQSDIGKVGIERDVPYKIISEPTLARALPSQRGKFMPVALWLDRTDRGNERLRERLTLQAGEPLEEFFGTIFNRNDEIVKARDLQRLICRRLVERAHENAVGYLELRINPRLVADRALLEEYAQVAAECNARWPAEEAVELRFVVGVHRGTARTAQDLKEAFQAAAADDAGHDLIVGVDLVGLEDAGGAPSHYLAAIRDARTHFPAVRMSLHAGESTERDTHVRDSILLGADRIGHGTNLALDRLDTLRLVKENHILIEVSLISSHLLYKIPFADHPFCTYLNCGIPLSLNTDDGGIFDSTLTDEFTEAVLAFDLSWDQVRSLCENSLQYSFANAPDKAAIIERWRARWRNFENDPAR